MLPARRGHTNWRVGRVSIDHLQSLAVIAGATPIESHPRVEFRWLARQRLDDDRVERNVANKSKA
jgi:hypothetical protein